MLVKKENFSFLFRTFNIWMMYIALMLFSSYLPHWDNMSFHNWLNESLYFLLFLFAFHIFLKDKNNRDIFFNLSILFLLYSFSFINIFIGDNYLLGDDSLLHHFFIFQNIILVFFLNFVIIFITIKFLFYNFKTFYIYILSSLFLLIITISHLYTFIFHPTDYIALGNGYIIILYKKLFLLCGFSFVFTLLYGYKLIKQDFIVGRYINSLMAFFFIYIVIEMIDILSYVYGFRIFSMSQYILTFNLLFLATILFRKLLYTYSDYGQFYESMITQSGRLGKVQIQQHGTEKQFLVLRFIKLYVSKRRNYLLTLAILTGMGIAYFQFPKFFTINILAFAGSGVLLFAFVGALYRKKSVKNFLMS